MTRPATTVLTAALASILIPAAAFPARLPWPAAERASVTQDCNDTRFDDHVGLNGYAWDFATGAPFNVTAPRDGRVVHVKMSSHTGGADPSNMDAANYIVLDHGDGTYSVMLHLAHDSLAPAARCGAVVHAGDRLAVSGSTGWSTGNHLHYQVNGKPAGNAHECECGADGMACGEREAHWELFWPRDAASATVPVDFEEWQGASQCPARARRLVLESHNRPGAAEANTAVAIAPAVEPRALPASRRGGGPVHAKNVRR